MNEKNCVTNLVDEIRKSLKCELYMSAVMVSLTLPDMCGALEKENFWASNKTYVDWCQQNLPAEFFSLASPELMKEMRNNLLHTGRLDDAQNHGHGRLILTLPDQRVFFQNNKINDDYLTDVRSFCLGLCQAATKWLELNYQNPVVQKNLTKMTQMRPNGISPYLLGIKLIA